MYGFYFKGKENNYYYNVDNGEFYYFYAYPNGHEDDEAKDIGLFDNLSFEQFLLKCKEFEQLRNG